MDKKIEDKMVQQIEKNLHNNIDESLNFNGHILEKDKQPKKSPAVGLWKAVPEDKAVQQENPLISLDYYNPVIPVSRSEYIRQARESCLRQLSTMQSSARAYDSYYLDNAIQNAGQEPNRKTKPNRLFQDGAGIATEEENQREIASFRFLVMRMVCALLLFLSIFLIDKFDVKIGNLSPGTIQEYVTGKDSLKELEEFVVTLLKE